MPSKSFTGCKNMFKLICLRKPFKDVKMCFKLPYFFGYKTESFYFQNNPKDVDPSCKTGLDLWDCLGRVKLVL